MLAWLTPLLSFAAVFIAAWLVRVNERHKRKLEFMDKQLRELYSPILSLRKEIRALSELRVRVSSAASETWHELCEREGAKTPDYKPFGRIIDYDNEQMRKVLLPRYDKMLEILTSNFYLANEAPGSIWPSSSSMSNFGIATWIAPSRAKCSQSSTSPRRNSRRSTKTSRRSSTICARHSRQAEPHQSGRAWRHRYVTCGVGHLTE
jgi:hypothetical protein